MKREAILAQMRQAAVESPPRQRTPRRMRGVRLTSKQEVSLLSSLLLLFGLGFDETLVKCLVAKA